MFASDSPTYLLSTSAEQMYIITMEDNKSMLGSYDFYCLQVMYASIENWDVIS